MTMGNQGVVCRAARTALLALIGMGFVTADIQYSYAYCGGHCQAGKMCADLVSRKGLKDKGQRTGEYQKCMRDPNTYK
jgi:hypothetical protein